MNWFERYGFPGLYFVGLTAGWVYAFCPQIIHWENLDSLLGLTAALIAISPPIGYVISITGQSVYLNWRRCLWKYQRVRGWLGVHGAAMDRLVRESGGSDSDIIERLRDESTRDEATNEARTLLLTASRGPLSVNTHRYMRDWIARRMDVMAISLPLLLATLFAGIIALVICMLQPGPPCAVAVIVLSITSAVAILVMIWSTRILRRQVIEVITGIYSTYR